MVYINHEGTRYHIGFYDDLNDAIAARCGAEDAIWGGKFFDAYMKFLSHKKIHKPFCTNTSGVRGVSWNSRSNKWQANGYLNNKPVHLGFFDDKNDAIRSRLIFTGVKHAA